MYVIVLNEYYTDIICNLNIKNLNVDFELRGWLLKITSNIESRFPKNIYIFNKYNFFDVYDYKFGYSYLDTYLIVIFIKKFGI